jgi:hypothetical protein
MGHERVGSLPRTRVWRHIVSDLARLEDGEDVTISDIAHRTLKNVRKRYEGIHKDSGVQAAFGYLLSLATERYNRSEARQIVGLDLRENPSPVRIAAKLNAWVAAHTNSTEYAEIARRAGGDTIAQWTQQRGRQDDLFEGPADARRVWQAASEAQGFCEVARIFFAKFTERYLRYFLEREASAELPSLEAREKFSQQLSAHVDTVSQHAFETSKIAQSFAAGWFNNHARHAHPSEREIEGFLSLSFGKLQEELQREAVQ